MNSLDPTAVMSEAVNLGGLLLHFPEPKQLAAFRGRCYRIRERNLSFANLIFFAENEGKTLRIVHQTAEIIEITNLQGEKIHVTSPEPAEIDTQLEKAIQKIIS